MAFLINLARTICAVALLALASGAASAQTVPPYQVKAAFLYNFIKFVEWPAISLASTETPYVIGVLGRDPFGAVLDQTMRGKKVNGRTIVVQRVTERDMHKCHVLFISSSERRRLREILSTLGSASVLTVSDMENFAENGGMIGFVIEANKVRFEINIAAAKRADLRIHPTLLDLAKIVRNR